MTVTTSVEQAFASEPRRRPVGQRMRAFMQRPVFWVIVLEVVLVFVFGIASPHQAFWSEASIANLSLASSQVLLLCVTQAMLLAAGKLDLSQGAIVILASVAGGQVMVTVLGPDRTGPLPVAIGAGVLAAIVVGGGVGLVNGLLVAKVGLNPLVATLGMLSVATGTGQVLTNGTNIVGIPTDLQQGFAMRTLAGLPLPIVLSLGLVFAMWVVFSRTSFGVHTLVIGSSEKAASYAGIRVSRHVMVLYLLSGLAAGIAAVIDLSRFATTDISGHTNDSLAAISGAVIGGTSLFGGVISFPGAIFGCVLAVILQVGLVVLNLPPFYQTIAIGLVLIGAVTIDRVRARRSPAHP